MYISAQACEEISGDYLIESRITTDPNFFDTVYDKNQVQQKLANKRVILHAPYYPEICPLSADTQIATISQRRFNDVCNLAEELNAIGVVVHLNYLPALKSPYIPQKPRIGNSSNSKEVSDLQGLL
jgi:endonuclease IV